MTQVSIIGLERTLFSERTDKGYLFLAYFAAKVGPVTLKGCALAQLADGTVAAWMPNLSDKKQRKYRSVEINDREVRLALRREAIAAYERMGGEIPEVAEEPTDTDEARPIILPPPIRQPIAVKVTRETVHRESCE